MKIQIRMMKVLIKKAYYRAAREMKTRKYLGSGFLLGLLLFASSGTASAQVKDLFNNTNIDGVSNGPKIAPKFVLNASVRITQIVTYHWNFGQGARPGIITLTNTNGQILGQFVARGTSGQGGAPNVNWVADINLTVPAGSYNVLDSDPNTWSNNARSGFRGFAIVRGVLLTKPKRQADLGSDSPDTATLLVPVSSMPRYAPNLPALQTVTDGIGGSDTDDWYFLNVTGPNGTQQPRGVLFLLRGFTGNVQLELWAEGPRRRIFIGGPQGATRKSISQTLAPGNYLVRVTWAGSPTAYQLTILAP
jgi:hypothetical protein